MWSAPTLKKDHVGWHVHLGDRPATLLLARAIRRGAGSRRGKVVRFRTFRQANTFSAWLTANSGEGVMGPNEEAS